MQPEQSHQQAGGWTARILIVGEPSGFVERLFARLQELGANVRHAVAPAEALEQARRFRPAAIIVRANASPAPDLVSLQLCRSLRDVAEARVAALVLWTGCAPLEGSLAAFEAGYDEVLHEAALTEEALFRIRLAIRRCGFERPRPALRFADLELEPSSYRARVGGRVLPLTVPQTRLLQLFIEHPGRVFSRAELWEALWDGKSIDLDAIKTAVLRLRRLLSGAGGQSTIRNVKGGGYALDLASDIARPIKAEL